MTTTMSTPSVCRGAGKPPAGGYWGGRLGLPSGECPVCHRQVRVYEKEGRRLIGNHEGSKP